MPTDTEMTTFVSITANCLGDIRILQHINNPEYEAGIVINFGYMIPCFQSPTCRLKLMGYSSAEFKWFIHASVCQSATAF